jgi:hypothetical protein
MSPQDAWQQPLLRLVDTVIGIAVGIGCIRIGSILFVRKLVAIMEHTGLSRYVWQLPLFFVGLVVLFSSLIGMAVFP